MCVFHIQRWASCFQTGFVHLLVSTTNGLERLHETMKYSYLSDSSTGSLTDLFTSIAQLFIPALEQRFVTLVK
jgi:hypothetical protein